MITLPNGLKSSSLAVFMVNYGSRLAFHGSRSVFMVFHGYRLVVSWPDVIDGIVKQLSSMLNVV